MGSGADGGAGRIWRHPGGRESNRDGATEPSSGVYEMDKCCLSFGKLSPLSQPQSRGGGGGRQEFAVYAARTPLTNNPCALWHRQSCWLCYCWLLPTLPAQQAGPVCLQWYHPKNKGLHWYASLQAASPLHWLRQASTVPVTIPLCLQACPLQSVFLIFCPG